MGVEKKKRDRSESERERLSGCFALVFFDYISDRHSGTAPSLSLGPRG